MPSRAHMMSFASAPMLFTSLAGRPLYIVSFTNTWHSASMCDVAMPWKAMPMKSIDVSRPPMPLTVHASPATTMWCSAVSIPRPSRSNFTSPAAAQSSLSHWSTLRSAMRAHSTGHTSITGRSHSTMPPEWMPR